MTHKNNKLRNKIWSLALCASMLLSCLPISAFAESQDGEYVHEHTAECGHNYGEEETTESTENTETSESTATSAPAYTAEDVKAMIDALPSVSEMESMSEDELSKVHDKAQETVDAYESLTEDVQAELSAEVEKLTRLLEYMANQTMAAATEAQKLALPSSAGTSEKLSTFTYADGVTQYFIFNDHLYKIAYTNLSSSSFSFGIYNLYGAYRLILSKGSGFIALKSSSSTTYDNYLTKDNLPTTAGGILTGYIEQYSVDSSKPSITITCLELNNSPTWNWASDYSTASAVFTAKDYDVQVTVSATVSSKVTKYAAKCTEKDTVEYTAAASFGGVSGTDTQIVANGNIGPHSLTYSTSGNTITEYCGNNCGHKDTATLAVDSSVSLLYTSTAINPLKVAYSDNWWGGELEIKYADDSIALGTHSGSISKDGSTATQSFEIITPTLVTNDNYASLKLDSGYVGYYAISSAAELRSFAALINSNITKQKNAVLLNNIDLYNIAWTPIGTESQPYTGTFDGNGKTITNLSITATGNNQGLFGVVSGGTVKNFSLKGKIDITATIDISDVSNIKSISNVGGVVGYATSKAVIENVTAYVNITDNHTPIIYTDAKGTVQSIRVSGIGGIVGYMDGSTVSYCTYEGTIKSVCGSSIAGIVGNAANSSTVAHCTNKGNVTAENNSAHIGGIAGDAQTGTTVSYCINYGNVTSSGGDCIGGIVAYANQNVKIDNCGNLGTVTCTADGDGFIGGILGYINNRNFGGISNCFNYGSIVTKEGKTAHAGAILGYNRSSGNVYSNNYYLDTSCTKAVSDNAINDVYSMTADQFKSGEVAYKLNNGKTDGTQVWYQTCQSDSYPMFSGKTVYRGYICGSGSSEPIYANSMEGLVEGVSMEHQYDASGVCTNCGQSKSAVWNEKEQVYEIYNLGQLQWFADYVNEGNTNINGKLMADIGASSIENLGIGTDSNKYAGIFDGNGYTITIKLNGSGSVALFPYVNGATIKNLTVKGYITASGKYAATLVGQAEGNVTIEKCISAVEITSTVSGDGTHGGLVGVLNSGTLNINNCGFIGAINGSGTDSCGGLVGWSNGTTKISNSFVAATFSVSATNGNTFSRGNNITVTNCYYLNALKDVPSGATQKNANQFASGEVAYLLNGSTSEGSLTWYQTCGTGYPAFSGKTVYAYAICNGYAYANTKQEGNTDHSYIDGFCKYCDAYQPAEKNIDGYYEIFNAGQLYWFAALTNGQLTGIAQDTSANAILKNDIIVNSGVIVNGALASNTNGFRSWTPIGNYNGNGKKDYTGTFDGDGHTISGLYMLANNNCAGFIGRTTSTVMNLTIADSYFNFKSTKLYLGAVVGYCNGGKIENCAAVDCVVEASKSSQNVGGVVGYNDGGTVKNCISKNCTITGDYAIGGIAGYVTQKGQVNACASVDCNVTGGEAIGGVVGFNKGVITNCYNTVTVIGSKSIKAKQLAGGVAGQNNGTITNCYNTVTVAVSYTTDPYVGGVTGCNRGTITNCFYLSGCATDGNGIVQFGVGNKNEGSTTADVAGQTEGKTKDQFKSGEVAWLLNGSSSSGVWKQTIDSDAAPNFTGKTVYYDANRDPQYYNDNVAAVTITWTDMSFSYNKGTWNTDTMKWEGGGWEADAGCGTVSVKNTGNVGVTATFGVTFTDDTLGISVSFTENGTALTDNKLTVAKGAEKTVTVKLSGNEPSEYIETATTIGQITITLSTK